MQYVDVSKSDKVLVYQLPKDTCLLNDWHVLKNLKMYYLKPCRMCSYGRFMCGFYKQTKKGGHLARHASSSYNFGI